MSKFEDIVPPFELCKRIPKGAFKESALVWYSDKKGHFVQEREPYIACVLCPAPTLSEILAEFATVGCVVRVSDVGGNVEYTVSIPLSAVEKTDSNPAEAALLLWLELKNKEIK